MNSSTLERDSGSWAVVAFGIGIASFAAYHQFKLPVVLPVLLERFGYERTLAGAFVSVYALAGLVLSVWMGRMVTRHGAIRPVMIAMVLLLVGSAVTLASPSVGLVVLFGRGLEGVAFAALAVVGPVIASANAPPRQLALVIGMIAGWIPIGQMTATVLAHLSVERFGWTFLWWFGIAGALVIAALSAMLARSASANLSTGSPSRSPSSRRVDAYERTTLVMVGVVFMIWSGQYFAYMTWLPQYLVEVHDVDVRGALLGYLVPVIFVLVFNVLAGVWMRAGAAVGAMLVGGLCVQSLVWWALPLTNDYPWFGLTVLAAYGCSAGIVPTCLFAMPSSVLGPSGNTAQGFGIIMTGRNLGVLIGPVLLAWLSGGVGVWASAQAVFAVLTTLAVTVAALVSERLR